MDARRCKNKIRRKLRKKVDQLESEMDLVNRWNVKCAQDNNRGAMWPPGDLLRQLCAMSALLSMVKDTPVKVFPRN